MIFIGTLVLVKRKKTPGGIQAIKLAEMSLPVIIREHMGLGQQSVHVG